MALAAASTREGQIVFLLGGFVRRILHVWAETESLTVFDLECINAVIGRVRVSGRSPDFSTLAAKVFVRECSSNFELVNGKRPFDALQAAQGTMKTFARSMSKPKPGPKKGCKTAYGEFVKATSAKLKAEMTLQPQDDLCFSNLVRNRWKSLSLLQRSIFQGQADLANDAMADGAASATGQAEASGPRPDARFVQLVGDSSTILSEREYNLCRQLDNWDTQQKRWTILSSHLFIALRSSVC